MFFLSHEGLMIGDSPRWTPIGSSPPPHKVRSNPDAIMGIVKQEHSNNRMTNPLLVVAGVDVVWCEGTDVRVIKASQDSTTTSTDR